MVERTLRQLGRVALLIVVLACAGCGARSTAMGSSESSESSIANFAKPSSKVGGEKCLVFG